MKLVVGRERNCLEGRPESAVGGQRVRGGADIKSLNWQVVGCKFGCGQEILVGGGGGAIEVGEVIMVRMVVVHQVKALDLHLNVMFPPPTPIRGGHA